MKNNFLQFILSAVLLLALLAPPAQAARSCRVATSTASVAVELSKIKGADKLVLKGETLTRVKALFEQEGLELYARKIPEILEAMSEHLREGSEAPSVTKSDKLAKFGDQLIEITKGSHTKEQNLMIGYFVGEAVLRMEQIQYSRYKQNDAPEVFKAKGALHIKDFHKYVESYIDNTALYKNLPNEIGFIDWTDIRHLYSNNSWGIGLRHHDMYHLHYAYGHPYYLALNFMSARGINDRRYAMMSAFWESVDTNQTSFESKMSQFFKDKEMSPQEGMIWLARATKTMLNQVDGRRTNSYYNETALQVSASENIGLAHGWVPRLVKFGRAQAPEELGVYDRELETFINRSLNKRASPANKRYYNFHRRGPGKTAATDDDTSH